MIRRDYYVAIAEVEQWVKWARYTHGEKWRTRRGIQSNKENNNLEIFVHIVASYVLTYI